MVLVVLLLIFAAVFFFWRKRRVQVLVAAAITFWLLGSWLAGPLVRVAQSGHDMVVAPRFAPHMAFIVLGGGTSFDRNNKLVPKGDSIDRIGAAAALYKDCKRTEVVCRVIVSGGDPQGHERAEADVYAPLLVAAGIDGSDLLIENQSMDTYENARNVDKLLRQDRYDTLVLITSSLHMRRALLSFGAFGLRPQAFVATIRNPYSWIVPHPEGWIDSNGALHEMLGVVRFYVWRWLGWY